MSDDEDAVGVDELLCQKSRAESGDQKATRQRGMRFEDQAHAFLKDAAHVCEIQSQKGNSPWVTLAVYSSWGLETRLATLLEQAFQDGLAEHDPGSSWSTLLKRYADIAERAWREVGDILGPNDPAHFMSERLESLLFNHLIPAWRQQQRAKPTLARLLDDRVDIHVRAIENRINDLTARVTALEATTDPPLDERVDQLERIILAIRDGLESTLRRGP